MKLLLFFFPTILLSQAVTSSICYNHKDTRTGASSPVAFGCAWITDTAGDAIETANTVEYGTSAGVYTVSINRPLPASLNKYHIVTINAVSPSTTYYARTCTTISAVKRCGSEHTITTGAVSIVNNPVAPTEVDNFTAGTGNVLLVGADCEDGTTGLQARINASSLGDVIKIPLTTICAGEYTWPDKGAGTTGTKITTTSTKIPPAGTRVNCTLFDCSKIYRTYRNYLERNSGEMAALTGRLTSFTLVPGSIVYEGHVATWNVKKAAFSGDPIAILGATNATPIVLTVGSGHGISNNDILCAQDALGNVAVNQCHQAYAVDATHISLKDQAGNPRAGSGNWTSGGTFRPIAWTAIPAPAGYAGRLTGQGCYVAGDWNRDTTVTNFDEAIYRCGEDFLWYPVHTRSNIQTNAVGNIMFEAINALPDAHHLEVSNIQFPETPIPNEPEANYSPRSTIIQYGITANGTYFGAQGSHHIRFNQIDSISDLDMWKVSRHFYGQTTNWTLQHSRASSATITQAYSTESEQETSIINFNDSIGTFKIVNNYFKSGGWCFFTEEGTTFTTLANVTFEGNTCDGVPEYNFGTSYYSKSTILPMVQRTRQLLEAKQGQKWRIRGNRFNFLPISATPTAPAIALGTQGGSLTLFTVATDGVVTVNTSFPLPLSAAVNDIVVYYGVTTPILFRVASLSPFTLKNLDGTAYSAGAISSGGNMCNINTPFELSDILIEANTASYMTGLALIFGTSYQNACEWAPVERLQMKDNFLDLYVIGQTGGWYGTTVTNIGSGMFAVDGHVNNTQISQNAARNVVAANDYRKAFTSDFSTAAYKNYNLIAQKNLFPANDFGILGTGYTGQNLLTQLYPIGTTTWTNNAYIRAGGAIAGEPSGNFYPTEAEVKFTPSGPLELSSPYYSYQPNWDLINQYQGTITNIRISSTSSAISVEFRAPNSTVCSLDYSDDNWVTYSRATATGSGRNQIATFSGPSKTTYKMRLMCADIVSGLQMSTK